MELRSKYERPKPQKEYICTLETVRDRYAMHGLNPLFVGGVITKAVTLSSIDQMQFDHLHRAVCIPVDTNQYTSLRKDGTRDDFDIIVNHPDKEHVDRAIEDAQLFLKWQEYTHHFVSTEAVRYPHWKKRNQLTQMVSGIDVDDEGTTRFTFGKLISEPVHPETLAPWTYVFEDNGREVISLPSFNPAFIGFRYMMRVPLSQHGGLRAKDTVVKTDEETGKRTTKIHTLMKLRAKALETGKEQGHDYDSEAWQHFILQMQHRTNKDYHQDKMTHIKSELMHLWWTNLAAISTAAAHGKGVLEVVAKTGNKFGG